MTDIVIKPSNSDGSVKLQTEGGTNGLTMANTGVLTTSGNVAVTGTMTGGTLGSGVTFPAGHILQVQSTNWSNTNQIGDTGEISETTAYNNNSLTPLSEVSITPISATSYFYITLSGRFGINSGYRSQILLSKNWNRSTHAYGASEYIWYNHYGMYRDSGGSNDHTPGQFQYMDKHQDQTAGTSRTYSWFGGSIGSGTQTYRNLVSTVWEIMQ